VFLLGDLWIRTGSSVNCPGTFGDSSTKANPSFKNPNPNSKVLLIQLVNMFNKRLSSESIGPFEPMTDEQLRIIHEVMRDPAAAIASLPEAEQQRYRDAQESVVKARRAGERLLYTDGTLYG
jgi:hypothetical protein